jgi:hypothetical protein
MMKIQLNYTRARKPISVLTCDWVFVLLLPAVVAAQSTGAITGRVTDQFGAIIIGAAVTITDESGIERKATTDTRGSYTVSVHWPARYSVRIEAPVARLFYVHRNWKVYRKTLKI